MFILQLSHQSPHEWLELNDAGDVISRITITELTECPKINVDANLMILFPGEDITLMSVTLPKMRMSEKLLAIPFALEEQIASDPEQMGVALGDDRADGSMLVAIYDKNNFEACVQAWHAVHLFPRAVVPDFLSIKWEPESWSIVLQNNMAWVRTDVQRGFSVDVNNLFLMLQMLLEKNKNFKPNRIICWQNNVILDVAEFEKLSVPVALRDAARDSFFDIKQLFSKPALNLLQGKYRAKAPSTDLKKSWMVCGYTFVTLILLLFVGNIAQWFYFQHQSNKLETQVSQAYRTLFPGATQILEPHFRVAALLKKFQGATKGSEFLRLLSVVGETTEHMPALTLQTFDFSHNQLALTYHANTLQTVQQCVQQLQMHGLKVTQQISNAQTKNITAVLMISG